MNTHQHSDHSTGQWICILRGMLRDRMEAILINKGQDIGLVYTPGTISEPCVESFLLFYRPFDSAALANT